MLKRGCANKQSGCTHRCWRYRQCPDRSTTLSRTVTSTRVLTSSDERLQVTNKAWHVRDGKRRCLGMPDFKNGLHVRRIESIVTDGRSIVVSDRMCMCTFIKLYVQLQCLQDTFAGVSRYSHKGYTVVTTESGWTFHEDIAKIM